MERLSDVRDAVSSVVEQTLKPQCIVISVDNNEELYHTLTETYVNGTVTSHKTTTDSLPAVVYPESQILITIINNTGSRGLSETRNIGVRAHDGDIIAFIDDDAVADSNWLDNIVKHFENTDVVSVGGRTIPLWLDGYTPLWFSEELNWIIGCTYAGLLVRDTHTNRIVAESESGTIRNTPGCNMAFRRSIFDRIGFFRTDIGGIDETPRGGEEADLCLRIKREMPEALIVYEPDAVIQHKVQSRKIKLSYIVLRSFNEGIYKAKVRKLHLQALKSKNHNSNEKVTRDKFRALSTENYYLRYLLFKSIPDRFRRFYKPGNIIQSIVIIFTIITTSMGYLIGMLKEMQVGGNQ